jgi:hypothetical protein
MVYDGVGNLIWDQVAGWDGGIDPLIRSGLANSGANADISSLSALGSVNGGPIGGRRNRIINGSFDVWQLGNSINITGHLQKCADRWNYDYNGTIGTLNISRAAAPNNWPSRSVARLHMTVAPTGNTFQDFSTQIEGVKTLSGKQVTISFDADSEGTAASIIVKTEQYFGSGGSPSASLFNTSAPIPIAQSTYARYSVTFTMADVSTKTLGTNGDDSLDVILSLPINQTFDLYIGNVQIEIGAVATPFEYVPYAQTYAECQRYLQSSYDDGVPPGTATAVGSVAFFQSGTSSLFTLQCKTPMRTLPFITYFNPSTGAAGTWNGQGTAIAAATNTNGTKNITVSTSGGTAGAACSGHYVLQDPYY